MAPVTLILHTKNTNLRRSDGAEKGLQLKVECSRSKAQIQRVEELNAEGLSKQNTWTPFRNRVSNDWVWTARTAGLPAEAAAEMDEQAMRFFRRNFVTGAMNDSAERRIFHPVSDGGMGIPKLQRAAPAATAASWAAALDDVLRITNTTAAEDLMTPGTTLAVILTDTRARFSEAAQHTAPAPMATLRSMP